MVRATGSGLGERGLLAVIILSALACADHPFQSVPRDVSRGPRTPDVVAFEQRATDILLVVDNSPSMQEEQERLLRSLTARADSASLCDPTRLQTLAAYLESHRGWAPADWPAELRATFDDCQLMERLQLGRAPFRVGVITTDMNDCDQPPIWAPRGSIPQRGCLQTSASAPQRTVIDQDALDPGQALLDVLREVGTHGSDFEQGLAATQHFLTPGHAVPAVDACDRPRDCAGDLDAFWRLSVPAATPADDALEPFHLIVFIADEDDCSHDGSINELDPANVARCSGSTAPLIGVDHYLDFLGQLELSDGLLGVVLLGGLGAEASVLQPQACSPQGGLCDVVYGASVETCATCTGDVPTCRCHPALTCNGAGFPATSCCQVDATPRYYSVTTGMERFELISLCEDLRADDLFAATGRSFEPLRACPAEAPDDPTRVVVLIRGARWDEEWTAVPFYDLTTELPAGGGWSLDQGCVRFWGSWYPESGDQLIIEVEGE